MNFSKSFDIGAEVKLTGFSQDDRAGEIIFEIKGDEVIKLTQSCAYLYGKEVADGGVLYMEMSEFLRKAREVQGND